MGKLTSNMDTIGKVVGFVYGAQKVSVSEGGTVLNSLEWTVNQLMRNPHFPDLHGVMDDLMKYGAFTDSIKITVAGMIMEYIDVVPGFSKWGKTIGTLGWNMMLGTVLYHIVQRSSAWHSPRSQPQSGFAGGGNPFEGAYGK